MVKIPPCSFCAGKRPFCIHKSYPLPKTIDIEKRVSEKLKKDFFGPGYSVFVGHYGYPNVFVGPMTGIDQVANDNPKEWFGKSYPEIIELRSMMIRSKAQESVHSRSRYVEQNQELALAAKAPDTEIQFKEKPQFRFTLSETMQPMGPTASVEKFRITENVKVSQRIEKIVDDELRATEASFGIYNKTQNVYQVSTILSSGLVGLEKNKKMVPTRWSITATDDIIAKELMKQVRDYKPVKDFLVFTSSYMDNHFTVLIMPGEWEFENFEVWAPGSNWSSQTDSKIIEEYEPYKGRSSYADKQAGGYYATRISVLEYLHSIKRAGRVVVFREVGEEYSVPLGVWVVRETAKHTFENRKTFSTQNEALDYVKTCLRLPLSSYRKKSKILQQKRLWDFG